MASHPLHDQDSDIRRRSYDDLLDAEHDEYDSDSGPAEPDTFLCNTGDSHDDDDDSDTPQIQRRLSNAPLKRRAFFVRCLALLCACFLSVGSH